MSLYEDARYSVRDDLEQVHRDELNSLAGPGTWWTGAQRAALVEEARSARCDAGLQEADGGSRAEKQDADADLPDAARAVARQVAASPKDIDRAFFDTAVADGISDAEYVEIVGVAARAVTLDLFARGLGVPPRELPGSSGGAPSGRRPASAIVEGSWPATIPNGRRGGQDGEDLYHGEQMANIMRALSLVPPEAQSIIDLGKVQYLPLDKFLDFDFTHDPAISRAQVELVAGRVSAINECFY